MYCNGVLGTAVASATVGVNVETFLWRPDPGLKPPRDTFDTPLIIFHTVA
jgi:hypothetical protein